MQIFKFHSFLFPFFWLTLNTYLNRFRPVKRLNSAMSWNAWNISTALFPVLRVFWQSNMAFAVEKYLLKTPGNGVSKTLNSKTSLDASALKNLCLWCEFQSRLLFIISLPLKSFLTALWHPVKANCRVKGKLFICFWSAISFFSTFRHISLASRSYS